VHLRQHLSVSAAAELQQVKLVQQKLNTLYFNKENKMKLIYTTILALSLVAGAHAQDTKPAENKGEKKEVCTDVKDKAGAVVKNKDGTVKQTCKTITVRKKYEGTAVPDKK
jgi:hypothetical protein